MSSRVQKGGTLFRPVAKTRGRQSTELPTSQSSSDNFSNTFPSTTGPSRNESSTAMLPPPSIIPRHSALNLSNSLPTSESQRLPATELSAVSSAIPSHVPPQHSPLARKASAPRTTEVTAISVPSRKTPTPLVIGQSRHSLARSRSTTLLPSTTSTSTRGSDPAVAPVTTQSSAVPSFPVNNVAPTIKQAVAIPGPSTPPEDTPPIYDTTPSVSPELVSRSRKRVADRVTNEQSPTEPPTKRPRRLRSKKSTSQDSPVTSNESLRRSSRRVSSTTNPDPSEDSDVGSASDHAPKHEKPKRRSSTAPTLLRQSKAPSLPPYDPETSGADLDPTAVTMANLCKDTGQGRVSSKAIEIMNNHLAWKLANREKRARMIELMEAKKFGRILDQEEEAAKRPDVPEDATEEPPASSSAPSADERPSIANASSGEFDYSRSMTASRFNVQVRIGPNGETIVDEESLIVDTSAEQDTEHYTHIEESDLTKFVNSATHSKKYRGSRWTVEETELFYDALAQFGENYELISYVLPGRDRKACKNKFKAEDKKNPSRINYCLKNHIPYDINKLSRMTGKDFSGPTPIIRAPTPAKLVENDQNVRPVPLDGHDDTDGPNQGLKQSRTPSVIQGNDNDEEVLGDVENFEEKDDDT